MTLRPPPGTLGTRVISNAVAAGTAFHRTRPPTLMLCYYGISGIKGWGHFGQG